jgi:hypothetical protein
MEEKGGVVKKRVKTPKISVGPFGKLISYY